MASQLLGRFDGGCTMAIRGNAGVASVEVMANLTSGNSVEIIDTHRPTPKKGSKLAWR